MLHLGSTYFIAKDMEKSIAFYTKLLGCEPKTRNIRRFVEFHGDNFCIALFNPQYDIELIQSGADTSKFYNDAFLEYKNKVISYGNNAVLNFWVEDLNAEYERVKRLDIGALTRIFFINVVAPYYCFIVEDPDGNSIEITGAYREQDPKQDRI
jgi:catechol 2,3-dioxygenase-like lactoylglutathione lyase family enzyme